MDDPDYLRGFRTILATEPNHPYIEHWWPPGHNIGYEHQFHNAFADFMQAILDKGQVYPNFYDGLRGMEVLDAGLLAADEGRQIDL
jgi:predicted dehydrogenase